MALKGGVNAEKGWSFGRYKPESRRPSSPPPAALVVQLFEGDFFYIESPNMEK